MGPDRLERLGCHDLLAPDGTLHVAAMKVQHHGALANITEELVHPTTADHYLLCGDGPEVLMTAIRYELPAGVFSASRMAPEAFANDRKLAACVQRYREGVLSQSKTCEIAGLSPEIPARDR